MVIIATNKNLKKFAVNGSKSIPILYIEGHLIHQTAMQCDKTESQANFGSTIRSKFPLRQHIITIANKKGQALACNVLRNPKT